MITSQQSSNILFWEKKRSTEKKRKRMKSERKNLDLLASGFLERVVECQVGRVRMSCFDLVINGDVPPLAIIGQW